MHRGKLCDHATGALSYRSPHFFSLFQDDCRNRGVSINEEARVIEAELISKLFFRDRDAVFRFAAVGGGMMTILFLLLHT